MKKPTDTYKRLQSVMKDINGDNRQVIKTMQDQIDYLMEFIDIQGEILEVKTGSCQRRTPVYALYLIGCKNHAFFGECTGCHFPMIFNYEKFQL